MPITIIPDTGVNNVYVNADTGLNIILSGVSEQNSVNISGAAGAITPHNYLKGLQGGQVGQYYHLSEDQFNNLVTGAVVLPSETGQFYPASNPSGFVTGVDLGGYVTGDVVRPSDTGIFIQPTIPLAT
jgi:hypothetical protein